MVSCSHIYIDLGFIDYVALFLDKIESFSGFQDIKNKARDKRFFHIWYPHTSDCRSRTNYPSHESDIGVKTSQRYNDNLNQQRNLWKKLRISTKKHKFMIKFMHKLFNVTFSRCHCHTDTVIYMLYKDKITWVGLEKSSVSTIQSNNMWNHQTFPQLFSIRHNKGTPQKQKITK